MKIIKRIKAWMNSTVVASYSCKCEGSFRDSLECAVLRRDAAVEKIKAAEELEMQRAVEHGDVILKREAVLGEHLEAANHAVAVAIKAQKKALAELRDFRAEFALDINGRPICA